MHPSVFIGTPTYNAKDYAWVEFLANLDQLREFYPGETEFMVADNSPNYSYAHYLKGWDVDVVKTPYLKTYQERLAGAHNAVRDAFLKSDCEWLLHLESDVLPPPYAIEKLLESDKKVITAMYMVNVGHESRPLINFMNGVQGKYSFYGIDYYVPFQYISRYISRNPLQVYSCGIGCTLIHRSVMELIRFRHKGEGKMTSDSWFYEDCMLHGIPAFLHTGIICTHLNQDWEGNLDFALQKLKHKK